MTLFDAEAEKRRFDRVSNHFFIRTCKTGRGDEDEAKVAGIVHDISEGGISFLTNESYAEGDLLEMEIEASVVEAPEDHPRGLLNAPAVTARGTVTRATLYEFGPKLIAVRFDPLEKTDHAMIREAISRID